MTYMLYTINLIFFLQHWYSFTRQYSWNLCVLLQSYQIWKRNTTEHSLYCRDSAWKTKALKGIGERRLIEDSNIENWIMIRIWHVGPWAGMNAPPPEQLPPIPAHSHPPPLQQWPRSSFSLLSHPRLSLWVPAVALCRLQSARSLSTVTCSLHLKLQTALLTWVWIQRGGRERRWGAMIDVLWAQQRELGYCASVDIEREAFSVTWICDRHCGTDTN